MALEKTNGRMRPQIARSTQMPCGVIVKHTDRAVGATDGHGFFRMRKVVSMRARLRHVPKGQKFIAQGVASLALGYGGRWAFSPHSLTFNTATLTRASAFPYLSTRLLSHEPAPSHTFQHGSSHTSQSLPIPFDTATLTRASTISARSSNVPIQNSMPFQYSTSLTQQFPFNTQHSTPNIPRSTIPIQHTTFNTQPPTFNIIKCWG